MKTFASKLILLLCGLSLVNFGVLRAQPEDQQPHMEEALHFLQDAKKSDAPVALLNSAKEALSHAARNKAGFRKKALGIVDDAIALAQGGDHQRMLDKINAAIAEIHTAMSKSS